MLREVLVHLEHGHLVLATLAVARWGSIAPPITLDGTAPLLSRW
jgi:hypothetical protein